MDQKGFAPKPKTTTPEAVKAPSPSLPKGGGAVRGMGEKFAASLVSGTGNLTVPIAVSPGRGGFGPELAVSYDSGGGNGPFGVGFHLSVPSISRKTDRGLPEYQDDQASDVFILSGAEDLVPKYDEDETGKWERDEGALGAPGEHITRYRPRVEGLFARIERVKKADGDVFWRATTKDNVTSIYGETVQARITKPGVPHHVFTWLLERTEDAFGNVVVYKYKAEDLVNVAHSTYESHRLSGNAPVVNRYLKRILYGNTVPGSDSAQGFLFEVVFDYGEHNALAPTPTEETTWPCRQDPFSTYRSTFEVRTYRLCRRALMFHRFAELGQAPVLVRSTDFTYTEDPALTRLVKVTQSGYKQAAGGGYTKKSMPPLDLGYTLPELHTSVKTLDPESLADLPGGVDGQTARWVDLDGEGLPGVLCEQEGAYYYKQNLGDGYLAPARLLTSRPGMAASGRADLLDVGHEGRQCMVELAGPMAGFHERKPEGGWGPFVPFRSHPNIDWNDPRVRFIDLSGDGLEDLLVTTDQVQLWFPSLGKEGWGPPRELPRLYDENASPTLVFADLTGAIFLADMSGDGLQDIVRIRNGNVCYWPNKGRGRFGAKVQMAKAPLFDDSHKFDPWRIRLADVDGTGTTDIVYIRSEGAVVVFNQAGNAWSAPKTLPGFPTADAMSTIAVMDLLGTGTACLVWSSPWRGVARPAMRYIDLLGSKKPYLLTSVKNNLGAETKLEYSPSTKFYLEDVKDGKPWITRLAFPVHVLTRMETYDSISKARFVSTYRYHHGYYDGADREFRGFGLVEQYDTESFSGEHGKGLFTDAPEVDEEFYQPPVLTKTWFHTGAFFDRDRLSKQFAEQYYKGDAQRPELPDAAIEAGLTTRELREACRALKGQMLRTEVYALDGSALEKHPYVVTESCAEIRRVQPPIAKAAGSFYAYVRESVQAHYERNPADPRVVHSVTVEVDEFGHVKRAVSIAYARRSVPQDMPEQGLLATLTESDVIHADQQASWYRLGVPKETRTYQLTGLSTTQSALFTFKQVRDAANDALPIAYEATPNTTVMQKRLVERVRQVYYDSASLSGASPTALSLGTIDALALPYETYALAFSSALLSAAYGTRVTSALLTEGGYIEENNLYWVRTGRQVFDPAEFYQAVEVLDAFGNSTTITYDAHHLLVTSVVDALGNTVTVENDYRTLAPVLVTDPNGNRGAAKSDELGMIVATAVMGKVGSSDGDTLSDPTTTFSYDLDRWRTLGKPNVVHGAARERHGDPSTPWQHSYTYLDGLGRELMKKAQAEPGLAPVRDTNGGLVLDQDGAVVLAHASPRWVGTGRVVIDNKGNPVKQYEPFFSSTHEYEDELELVEWGVTPILRYDPLGRLIRTDLPNGTYSRVAFTPWEQASWDPNDTVLEPGNAWYAARQGSATPAMSAQEQRAASLAAAHAVTSAGTPAVQKLDVLGRAVRGIEDNAAAGLYTTKAVLDIEGNPVAIVDARDNTAMTYTFDMLGRTLYQNSVDAGERWTFADIMGKPIRGWDSRGHVVRSVYDELQRRVELWVKKDSDPEVLAEVTVYGEGQTDPEDANLRGRVYQAKDGAGVATSIAYDFKGNLMESQRQLAEDYENQLDWSASPAPTLETEVFTQTTAYDALNRPVSMTTPDASELKPVYNAASLLEGVEVRVRGASTWTTFVDDIDYDAKGQREKIVYGNGVTTEYSYDPLTYRLKRIKTTRSSDSALLQDLRYTYDPVGNIVEMADLAQDDIYHNSQLVEPVSKYVYDAIYRLIQASGREHAGQNADVQQDQDGFPLVTAANPKDPQAMRNYTEEYDYDKVGNILEMFHGTPSSTEIWTRRYNVAQGSNRLLGTSVHGDATGQFSATYTHDAHGNMTEMPHLDSMGWDFKDQMREVDKGGGGTVYFTYDAGGQRVRKVWEHSGIVEERIYLGGFEIYRRRESGGVVLERETLHVMDDTRRIAMVETKTVDTSVAPLTVTPRVRYQLGNHLGSASLELDEDSLVISYEEYHPYGTTSYYAAASGVEVSVKRYRYTGKERDEETGLYYHGARYYAPWLGRWTSADPSGMVDGPCLYSYVRNSPAVFHDPTGREALLSPKNLDDASALIIRNLVANLAPHEFKYLLKPTQASTLGFTADISKNGSKRNLEVEWITGRNAQTSTSTKDINVKIGLGVATGKTTQEQRRQVASALYHEMIHVELAVGDPNSRFVREFREFQRVALPAVQVLQGKIDKFVDQARKTWTRNSREFRNADIDSLKKDIASFLVQEAYVNSKQASAFPGTVSLSEHLRLDLDGKLGGFWNLGKTTTARYTPTYESAKTDAFKEQLRALTSEAAEVMQNAERRDVRTLRGLPSYGGQKCWPIPDSREK